jgi:VIT1/CCC1 family predicted Fe2+/Mn2+ transporter
MEPEKRVPLLSVIDRVSEILFGLVMAVTIMGSVSIGSASRDPARAATIAALGCNIAWGLVDAVMYLMRTATERARIRRIAHQTLGTDMSDARRLIAEELPAHLRAITGDEELESMRRRLHTIEPLRRHALGPRDFVEAVGIFVLVVIATFPVVIPFLLLTDVKAAMNASRAITVGMLFVLGVALGRYAGYLKPLRTGLGMAVLGIALIAAVKALGG